MDVVQKLLDERKQSYDIVKKNCVRPPIITDHCEDCHDLHTDVQHYDNVSLNIPPDPLNTYHIDDEWQTIEQQGQPELHETEQENTEPVTQIDEPSETGIEQQLQEETQEPVQDNNTTIQEQEPINNNIPLFL